MKRVLIISLMVIVCYQVYGQDATEKKGRPNVPGILQIDYGWSFSADESVPFKVFGSRTLNFYYLQDLKIGSSKFSFNPGIGIGMDQYKFDVDSLERDITIVHVTDSSYYVPITNGINVRKSILHATYVDIPLELRFKTRPDDPARSFNVTLGGKFGFLLQGKSKVKYKEDNSIHKIKEIHPYHLSQFRYSAYLKIGTGGFDIYANYSITPLFEPGEGHLDSEPNMMTVGVSFNGF